MALGFMRRHRRWLFGFLWVVIAAFILFYIPAFLDQGEGARDIVARIGRRSISVNEFRTAFLEQLKAYERFQGRIDFERARQMGMPESVLAGLVQEALIAQEAERLGLGVDDPTLLRALQNLPQFQDKSGFIGGGELRRRLDLMGISEGQFLAQLRAGLLRQQLESLVTAGVSVSPAEVEREYRRRHEQARVEYALVDANRFREGLAPSETEVKQWFDAHTETYRLPERRVLSYLLLEREIVRRGVSVTDREIRAYYETNDEQFTRPEQVCASHILIKVKSSTDPAGHADDEARSLAEGLLTQVRKGADFAALAKKSSEDSGSAPNGGDLRCFPRGQMVAEFDEAAFELKPGETSDLVRSDFGYHIIRVASRQEEVTLPLEAVQSGIRSQLLARKTEEELERRAGAITAALGGRGRLSAAAKAVGLGGREGLSAAAQVAGLEIKKTAPMALGADADPLSSAAVAAAFRVASGAAVPQAFEVPKGLVFVAVAEVQAPRMPELKEVEEQARRDLVESRAFEQALAQARELRVRALGDGLEKAAKAMGLTRKETPGLVGRGLALGELGASAGLSETVFALPEKTLSDPVRTATGYAIVSVLEKKPFDRAAFEKDRESLASSLTEAARRRMFEAYLARVEQRFPVERTEAFRTALGGD